MLNVFRSDRNTGHVSNKVNLVFKFWPLLHLRYQYLQAQRLYLQIRFELIGWHARLGKATRGQLSEREGDPKVIASKRQRMLQLLGYF